jgi:phosphoserine phosphatase SerB
MSRLVVFDVDSTLLSVESLDFAVEIALKAAEDGAERTQQLKDLTDRGMAGALDFRTSLEQRIAIAGLNRDSVETAREALRQHLTPGMAELIGQLKKRKTQIAAVSGGFIDLIEPVLNDLGLEAGDIRANKFVFTDDSVTGFDRDNPLSRSSGKSQVVKALKTVSNARLAVMVGDGMTDFEAFAEGGADSFIGFGGVKERPSVRAKAPAYASSVDELKALLLA